MVIIAQGKYTVKSQVDTTGFSKIQQQVNLSIKQLEKMRVSSKNVFNEFSKGGKEAQNRANLLEGELKDINAQLIKQYQLQDKADKTIVTALKQRQKLANAELQTMKAANAAHTQGLSDIITKVGKFAAATAILGAFTGAMYKGIESVFELDKALTELRKVSDLAGADLEKFTDKAFEAGKELGRTGIEIIQATTEFAKAGFNEDMALQLGKIATLYQNIADSEMDAGTAASFIISQMKAFNINADDAIKIIDSVNEVSNKFAVSSTDIATALTKTSSAMAVLGNSTDETIGLVTAGTELMVGQAGKVARGLRTIGNNIANLANKNGELSFKVGESTKTLQLFDEQTGEMKSTYQVLSDISASWGDMSDAQRQSLAISLAGKNQFEVFTSVLTNFDNAAAATATSISSAGSAMEENAKYMDSIEAKVNKLNSAWSALFNNIVDSGLVKGIVDFGTAIVTVIDKGNLLVPILTAMAIAVIPRLIAGIQVLTIKMGELALATLLAGGHLKAIIVIGGALLAWGASFALQMNGVNAEVEKNNKLLDENQKQLDNTKATASKYLATIYELQEQENLSAEQKEKMRLAISGLNDLIPDLNAGIDATTGKLQGNISEVKKATDAYLQLARAEMYEAIIKQNADKIAANEEAISESKSRLAAVSEANKWNIRAGSSALYSPTSAIAEPMLQNRLQREINALEKQRQDMFQSLMDLEDILPDDEDEDGGGDGGDYGAGGADKAADAFEKLKDALDDYIDSLEHELFLAEQRGASEEERIGMMRKIQETLHSQANYYRSLNIAETSEEIQTLQRMWWQYEKSISTIRLDSMKKKAADMESVASYVADRYNQRIKDLQESRRLEEESWNAQIEAIRSTNEALEDNIALQEAQEALARAKSNKVRVYREGQGFVYEEDVTAVSEARKNLDKLNREQQLKDEVARLEKLKKQALDNIDTQIKRWEDYSKSWSEVASNYKKDQDKLLAEQVFGINTEQAGWEERLGNAKSFVAQYNALMAQIGAESMAGAGAATGGGGGGYVYTITTQKGKDIASNLGTGQTYKASDGSTWKKNSDGSLSVTTKAGNTYAGKYASGTLSARPGMANVDEHGSELVLRNPPSGRMTYMEKGDGVVPANLTKNLMEWGKFNPSSFTPNATGGGSSIVYQIDNLTLPSVRNAEDLINGLQTLKTRAMQKSKSRE